MHYPRGPSVHSRSIADIARGRLHHYGIENIPHNPYQGALRNFRTSSISQRDSPAELHLKTAGEIQSHIDTLEKRVEQAKKELQKKREEKKEDGIETGGIEL